ncbi:hypothetical protein LCI18_003687 [Fusarium solani-melongenae]|uniref:Uncharacterized protein n=1 Tax=Fusarium solani subsp. cucurbitae TaxID=2747967 RepID=A0ACD3YV32_FUSSC|nr:hypothetical protein LCI18_003687 [Fusarium solani-melongenae]
MARKSGRDPCEPKSWRPIALLSCIGKLVEKIVALRMVAALKDRLKSTQFGGKSTTEALQFMLAIVYGAWSDSRLRVVTLLALDISGAYDNVDRAELLKRLVDESMPDWIIAFNRSFLSSRRACFHMPGYKSDSIGLQTAPLLKVSWDTKSLTGSVAKARVCTFSYVDDTYLIAVSDSYEDNWRALKIMHRKLQHVARPLGISFGFEKYKLMHFHRPKTTHGGDRTVVHRIGGAKLTPADSLRVLGVEVDFQLNWNAHIGKIINNVNRALGYLAQISGSTWGPSLERLRQFYLTKIRPMITYACGAWFIKKRRHEGYLTWGLKQDQVRKLESLQHTCLRLLSGSFFKTSGLVLEKELHIESIWTVLYAQATTQRAKALSRDWTAGCRNLMATPTAVEKKNPRVMLNWNAQEVFETAKRSLRSVNDAESVKRWDNEKTRNKIISSWIKKTVAIPDCEQLWATYVSERKRKKDEKDKKKMQEDPNYRPTKLPAALTERWGKESFKYYRGLLRPQSTILLHCRTGIIGLNLHRNTIHAPRAKATVAGSCLSHKLRRATHQRCKNRCLMGHQLLRHQRLRRRQGGGLSISPHGRHCLTTLRPPPGFSDHPILPWREKCPGPSSSSSGGTTTQAPPHQGPTRTAPRETATSSSHEVFVFSSGGTSAQTSQGRAESSPTQTLPHRGAQTSAGESVTQPPYGATSFFPGRTTQRPQRATRSSPRGRATQPLPHLAAQTSPGENGNPDLNLSSEVFDSQVHPNIAWLKAYAECCSQGLLPRPHRDIFYFPTASFLQGIEPLLGGASFLKTNFNVGQPWDYKKLAETYQDLPFSALSDKYRGIAPDFDVSSPALDWVKVKLEFFEQQRESDYLHSSLNLCKREKKRTKRIRHRLACIETKGEDDTEEGQRMRTLFGDVHKVPPCMARFEKRRYRKERRAQKAAAGASHQTQEDLANDGDTETTIFGDFFEPRTGLWWW